MAEYLLYEKADSLPLDQRIIEHLKNHGVNKFESFENMNLMSFDFLDVDDPGKEPDLVSICQTKENLYFICEFQETLEKLKTYAKADCRQEKELSAFFALLLKTDIDKMEDLEERVTDTEDVLLKGLPSYDYAGVIINFRKELLRLKKYYEQLSQIFDGILENENKFIAKEDLRTFKFLSQKADRLVANVMHLRDYITQVREAYQAQIDIEQNRLMKVFTVVTVIFSPLMVIVGWYGTNLKLPEYNWEYGYLYLITLNLLVVIVSIIYFKKKKWL